MSQVNTIWPSETPSIKMEKGGSTVNKFVPLGVLAAGIAAFFALGLDQYVSFEALREHRDVLANFVAYNPLLAPLGFMVFYAVVVAFSLPGGAIMTIAGGSAYANNSDSHVDDQGFTVSADANYPGTVFVYNGDSDVDEGEILTGGFEKARLPEHLLGTLKTK